MRPENEFRFRNRQHKPPGGFQFKDPLTGYEVKAATYSLWTDLARQHRASNGLPPPDVAEMEHQNCMRLGENGCRTFCESSDPVLAVESIGLGIADIARGTATILALKAAGTPLVEQEQAEARALVCKTCPYNVSYKKPCGSLCGELVEIVQKLVGGRGTAQDDVLEACAVCKCSLKAKVHVPLKFLKLTETQEQHAKWPSECWMLTENA